MGILKDQHGADVTSEAGSTGPRVSIFYNASAFLTEALDIVLEQNFQDWELLLVDDDSTDGSTEIA